MNRIVSPVRNLLNRVLPEHQGKRELVFVIALFVAITGAGYLGGQFGWLLKEVPTSATPTVTVVETPIATHVPIVATPTGN